MKSQTDDERDFKYQELLSSHYKVSFKGNLHEDQLPYEIKKQVATSDIESDYMSIECSILHQFIV